MYVEYTVNYTDFCSQCGGTLQPNTRAIKQGDKVYHPNCFWKKTAMEKTYDISNKVSNNKMCAREAVVSLCDVFAEFVKHID